eukprot:756041-Hanusia_phi.AAC.2
MSSRSSFRADHRHDSLNQSITSVGSSSHRAGKEAEPKGSILGTTNRINRPMSVLEQLEKELGRDRPWERTKTSAANDTPRGSTGSDSARGWGLNSSDGAHGRGRSDSAYFDLLESEAMPQSLEDCHRVIRLLKKDLNSSSRSSFEELARKEKTIEGVSDMFALSALIPDKTRLFKEYNEMRVRYKDTLEQIAKLEVELESAREESKLMQAKVRNALEKSHSDGLDREFQQSKLEEVRARVQELEQLRERDAKIALDTIESGRRRAEEAGEKLNEMRREVDEQLEWMGMKKMVGKNAMDGLRLLFDMFRQNAQKNVLLNKRLEESRERSLRLDTQAQHLKSEIKEIEVNRCHAETRMFADTMKENQRMLDYSWKLQRNVRAAEQVASVVETALVKIEGTTLALMQEQRGTREQLHRLQLEEERRTRSFEREKLIMAAQLEETREDLSRQAAELQVLRSRCAELTETVKEKDDVILDYLRRWGESEEQNQELNAELECRGQELAGAQEKLQRMQQDMEELKSRSAEEAKKKERSHKERLELEEARLQSLSGDLMSLREKCDALETKLSLKEEELQHVAEVAEGQQKLLNAKIDELGECRLALQSENVRLREDLSRQEEEASLQRGQQLSTIRSLEQLMMEVAEQETILNKGLAVCEDLLLALTSSVKIKCDACDYELERM